MVRFFISFFLFLFLAIIAQPQARINDPNFSQNSQVQNKPYPSLFRKKVEENFFDEEVIEEVGFISLSLATAGEFGLHQEEHSNLDSKSFPSIFSLGLFAEGATPGYLIDTRITLLYDMIHVADYFTGKTNTLQKAELYDYTFFDLASSYRVAGKKKFFLHAGFILGHRGFLHQSLKKPAWTIYPGFSFGLRWFLSKKVLMRLQSEILIPIINKNVKSIFFLTNRLEFVFATKGIVHSPPAHSFLIVLGIENRNTILTFEKKEKLKKFTALPTLRVMFTF